MLGIGGVLTYKNSNLSKVLTTVPLERIVLETDAPYLSPVPYRGKRNESAYITEVLQKVADIYNVSKQETESITNNNAKRVFRRMTER
jgi:TatD DNase family protein